MLLTFLPSAQVWSASSYCYWIHLTGLEVETTPDFLSGGDYQPLIALEPGKLYSLSPGYAENISLSEHRRQEIQGHWYYLPRHLVKGETITLNFMLIDRDESTDDDLVLPMRSHQQRLTQVFDKFGRADFSIADKYIVEDKPWATNHMRFHFELERKSGQCYTGSGQGNEQDHQYRQENDLHHLQSRIRTFFDKPLVAGWKVSLYEERKTASSEEAYAIARRNLHELITLGRAVYELEGASGFQRLRTEFQRLYSTLRRKTLEVSYTENNQGKQQLVTHHVPALASEPEWAKIIGHSEAGRIPGHWMP